LNFWARFEAVIYLPDDSIVIRNTGNPQQRQFTCHIFGWRAVLRPFEFFGSSLVLPDFSGWKEVPSYQAFPVPG
jgi:hypothetical protein